jgi:EAL domain-containing protein (putative c-di-GMP-specific phosphodiesterase class I)
VASALRESGLDPWALELEISESFAMKDVTETVAQFARLRGLGVHLAMDDFGTGYSSLAHLARLPFDTLKIDRSFIRPLGHDRAALPLVEAMTGLAHKLGLRVVAEGVETVAQLEILRSFGCEQIQGYLTGRPVRPQVMEDLLTRNRAPALA